MKATDGTSARASTSKCNPISEVQHHENVFRALSGSDEDAVEFMSPRNSPLPTIRTPTTRRRSQKQHYFETLETSKLTTPELQRLVLIKQLENFEEQKQLHRRMEETLEKVD
ncbi:uncharacterized protein LOC134209876 [Armigeres subalbatus]|uniref:uncharacterized protein LOC134209876 n=1 Tax=Armigeres subalbatus TaxID=124917 RepID=UPI002ED4D1C2